MLPAETALKLAEALAAGMEWDLKEVGVYARHGITGERKTREIGMQTIRAGDIVGDHTILFGGPGERIEITHRAHTRDTFRPWCTPRRRMGCPTTTRTLFYGQRPWPGIRLPEIFLFYTF